MIRGQFYTSPGGVLLGFSLTGHAGYGEAGDDVVCAAVSSAAYLTANTITDVLHVAADAVVDEDGMQVLVPEKDAPLCRVVLEGLKLHLTALEEQYSDYLCISYLEVSTC